MRGVMMALTLFAFPAVALAQTETRNRVPIPPGSDGKNTPQTGQVPTTLVVEPVAMMIAAFDDDHDGKVTRDELRKGVQHSFDTIDTAHGGKMGYVGFADWAKLWLGDANALPSPFETDANGDNQITLDELQAKFAQIFTRLDKDKDGVLTRTELLTIRADAGRSFDNGKRKRGRGS